VLGVCSSAVVSRITRFAALSYGGERFDLGLTIDALLSVVGKSEYRLTSAGGR
jgi:hypothetical protein